MTKIDKNEILTSTVKSIFGAIPFGGTALNELFFEYNSQIKQKRLNKFVEILAKNFTENSGINLKNIKTEDFNDLFESVLRKAVQTKSELKLIRFKDILIKELNNPTEQTELIDLYLNLITSLSEEELVILFHHKDFNNNYENERDSLRELKEKMTKIKSNMKLETIIIEKSKYQNDYDDVSNKILEIKNKHKVLEKYRSHHFYGITEQKFLFYKQRLFSQGLIIDSGVGGIGTRPFQIMSITEFGVEFIDFIKESEN